ncbi:carboxypeptidase regulatory-like domain-containing protein [Methanocella sp. MCL-LM]|uniref:carboxypeptidase regulatory-like domain-containing protein n=1 Tax=Methanocella sp. MCL-LM TaxID=3412035 RepID=UPI003C7225CD
MLKTRYSSILIILIILAIFTLIIPVSCASQYGTVQGKVVDRYGNPISGATIVIQDGECRPVGSVQSQSDGTYSYNQVPVEGGSGTFRIAATLDKDDVHLMENTAFFMIYPLKTTSQDVRFYSYPASGVGTLYGVVSSSKDMIEELDGVVYLNNGMYTIYEGNKYGQWSFTIPAGDYTIWAERNKNLTTYKSQNYTVHVPSDDNAYQLIYMPMKEQAPYHVQPTVQRNVVYGQVTQKNGQPLTGATVELCKYVTGGLEVVDSMKTNSSGDYCFYNVNVRSVSEKFIVKVSWELNGEVHEQSSAPFDVYYPNTIGKKHEHNIPVCMNVASNGNLNIRTSPQGARILVDGMDTGKLTPCEIQDIPAGKHTVTLTLDGYYNDTSDVTIQPDKILNMNRTLAINTGSITINVQPRDAKIYLNDKYAGTGSVSLPKAAAGKYDFKVVRDEYQEEAGSFDLIAGRQVEKSFEMVAVPSLSLTYISYLLSNMISSLASIL